MADGINRATSLSVPIIVESFVTAAVERTTIPRFDCVPGAPEAGLRRFELDERIAPVTLNAIADGPTRPRDPQLKQHHFAKWVTAPVSTLPQHLYYSDQLALVGYATALHRSDGAAPFTFPRNGRPGRGLDVIWDEAPGRSGRLSRAIEVSDVIAGPMLCLGSLPDHFGHFMLEALPRLWAYEWARDRGLKVVVLHGPDLSGWQRALLTFAGVDVDQLVYAAGPALLTEAFYPGPLYRLHQSYHPRYKDFLIEMAGRVPAGDQGSERLFLGRGELTRGARLTNEAEIADIYRAFGYRIMSPEKHSVADQIAAARVAHHIAGPIGSQLYLALFQQRSGSTHVFASPDFVFADDALIAHMNDSTSRFIFPDSVTQGSAPRWDTFTIDPERVRAILQKQFG